MRHTSDHIIDQLLICMPTLELRLPAVMISINETRTDDFVGAVNDFTSFR